MFAQTLAEYGVLEAVAANTRALVSAIHDRAMDLSPSTTVAIGVIALALLWAWSRTGRIR